MTSSTIGSLGAMRPRVTYDRAARALTVVLEEAGLEERSVAKTAAYDEEHLVDLDENGRVLAIEVLTPEAPKVAEMAQAYGFEDRVPQILVAILEALTAPREVETGAGTKWTDMSSTRSHVDPGPVEWRAASASAPLHHQKVLLVSES